MKFSDEQASAVVDHRGGILVDGEPTAHAPHAGGEERAAGEMQGCGAWRAGWLAGHGDVAADRDAAARLGEAGIALAADVEVCGDAKRSGVDGDGAGGARV